MSSHSESIQLMESLKATIRELVEPIESIQSKTRDGETGYPNGLELMMGELTMVVLVFTNADLNITDEETGLLNNFRHAICGDDAFALSSHDYVDMCRKFLRIHPNRRLSIDHKPYSVQFLETYDGEHGTQYAEKAKAVFFEVAKAVIQADEREQSKETISLLNFKEILYPSDNNQTAPSYITNLET
ncbi:MAG TPA: hypothetical protein VEW46_13870 [Pyrinomonadaceae bacterium]|nr:hypothetical protein [Pyrinomonadaceae bacterium]